jgi:hypothetical protein
MGVMGVMGVMCTHDSLNDVIEGGG